MTTQTRLFVTAGKIEAERIFTMLEREFEEDGLPVSNAEIDEDREIFEVSVYTFEPDEIEPRIRNVLSLGFVAIPDGKPLGTFPGIAPGSDTFGLELKREQVPDIDWVAHSLEGLKPVRAGRFFVHGSHDRDKRRINELGIEIDAGQAFGTGHHGTTSGCLDMISQVIRREHPRNALDLGTGSAVLAIGIAKLAPIRILATDIDPVAVAVAQENVVKNGVAARIQTETATGFHHPAMRAAAPFDLIVANILARPLMQLAPEMRKHLAWGGSLILSGILETQREKVLAAYRVQGLFHMKTLRREGWVTLHLKAKATH
ncbi:50S ribosomal protein L11 methyltransferase [Phyllobacterium bourgognense]|uniref:Ribosomal protein L11 methyltransferase n=1 Tax=Phyllobacterium bourgognense TaxID=314236 RepID=A0A368Z0X9_9HYPH|nr:50S ribosomal protein L11 methyltransferase [Phyllobacterium bourgognense]RCW86081.1 [LSU ribosomal protein L11P]-lysine N-methyltransferase [Phyllobacterium bourgognense]